MKNFVKLFCLIYFFAVPKANGQDYLISFAGAGSATTVSTVKVENLTAGTFKILSGSDILHLTSILTEVNSIENLQSSELKIYPNPMTDNSVLQFYPPVTGDAIISVCDITGIIVTQIESYLENYSQEFRLSGLKNGFYIVNVKGNTYQFSGKVISNGKSNGTTTIEKVSNYIDVDKKVSKMDAKGVQTTVDMEYTTGDILKFTAISDNFSTIMTVTPDADKLITFDFVPSADGDAYNYPVVEIGAQTWMAENLKTTKYNDGTAIPNIILAAEWKALSTPGYCWYNNDEATYKATYGALYNWYTLDALSNGGKNVCPTGWHVPNDADWTMLTTYLGDVSHAGDKLKESGTANWASPNTGTNETGFTALPGGFRFQGTGLFYSIGELGNYWSSTEDDIVDAWYQAMGHDNGYIGRGAYYKKDGQSVRCIKKGLPSITTNSASSITNNTIICGGNITSDGGTPVTARGVCWSTLIIPTTSGSKTSDGAGTGAFTSSINGLTEGKTYYVRAYAINEVGTAYGNVQTISTPLKVTDTEGNIYNTVTIGTYTWMAENLKTTEYNDGTSIPTDWTNSTTPAYCWYNNDLATYKATYGALYNWHTVKTGKLCPSGWHVPSDLEWTEFIDYLGGEIEAGGKLKESGTTHWNSPNTGGINKTGFTALPGGLYDSFSGGFAFAGIGGYGYWWSSAESNTDNAWFWHLSYDYSGVLKYDGTKPSGFSVRCLRHEGPDLPIIITTSATSITQTTALSGGNLTNNVGATVTASGVCWSTTSNPVTTDSHSTDGAVSGTFTSSITGLTANTTYYVRAYATHSYGISYGAEIPFTTAAFDRRDITAGQLSTVLTATELNTLTKLALTGTIDARDFKTMRDNMPQLAEIDISMVSIAGYTGTEGTSIEGNISYPANTIPESAFYNTSWQGKNSLTSFVFSTSLIAIGKYAFTNCNGLISIPIPSSVTTIGQSAFSTCNGITTVTIPASVSSIGRGAFLGCKGLITVDLNNQNYSSVNGILFNKLKTELFLYPSTKSGSYNIPSTVITIGTYAFWGCTNLTSVTIPTSVTSIKWAAFAGCSGLINVTIPASVLSLERYAFQYCTNLTSVIIPSSVTSIGNSIFQGCSKLASIYSYSAVPVDLSSSPEIFSGVNLTTCKLYVPFGAKNAYQAAIEWQNFTNIVEMPETVTDVDGNSYSTVIIGTQSWLASNLKTTKYRNGDLIGTTTPVTLDLTTETTPKYQWAYNGNESNVDIMGRLYTFYAITDSRGVCPLGWHIPSDVEWTTLTTYLGGEAIAGGKLKETGTAHWTSPNTGATNETGFTAIPGGLRTFDGYFLIIGRWWSATESNTGIAYGRTMNSSNASVYRNLLEEKDGNSVRCTKDN